MTPQEYDAWYHTARGRWIGETEYRLIRRFIEAVPGASVLDAGCGSGYFTRRFAADGFDVTGIDADADMIRCARARGAAEERYLVADARALPFPDRTFDYGIAITSLCFVPEPERAVRELARISRRRVILGLLNRASLLHARKGRHRGRGAYRGARWDTAVEACTLLAQAGLRNVTVRSAVFLPGGGAMARVTEPLVPARLPLGGFLLAAGERP